MADDTESSRLEGEDDRTEDADARAQDHEARVGNDDSGDETDAAGAGEREPATPEDERALEKEELESFRRRKQWYDEVLGGEGDAGAAAEERGTGDDDSERTGDETDSRGAHDRR